MKQLQLLFHEEGLTTQVDTPFSGGNIIATFGKQARIEAVQIEVPYSLYLEGHSLHPERASILQTQFQNIFQKSTDVSFLIRIKNDTFSFFTKNHLNDLSVQGGFLF